MNERDQQPKKDAMERAVESLRRAPVPDGPPSSLIASTVEAVQTATTPETVRRQQRRKLMFRIAGFSGVAAAIVLIAIVIGFVLIVDQSAAPAFADVIDNVKKAKSVVFTNKQKLGNQPEFEFTWYIQGEHIRIEMPNVMAHIANLKKKKSIQLNFVKKTASRKDVGKGVARAFRNPLEQIRNVKPAAVKKSGQAKVNNKVVDVYHVNKIDFMGMKGKGEMTLWVDPKTNLPVRIRIGANSRLGAKDTDRPFDTQLILENFSWHANLDPAMFRLDVPKGFTLLPQK